MDCILFYLPKYRQKWVAVKMIENAELSFEYSFYSPGRFTLKMSADDDLISILKEQCIIVPMSPRAVNSGQYDDPLIVEKVYMNEDEEKGKSVTLSGRSADAVFSYRILLYINDDQGDISVSPIEYSNYTAPDVVMSAFNEVFQIYGDSYPPRKIPWLHIASTATSGFSRISVSYKGENFLEVVNELREKYKFGIKAQMIRAWINDPEAEDPDEWVLDFTIFKPKDYTSGNNPKVVSANNGDIETTEYNFDKTVEVNAVIAIGAEEGVEFPVLEDTGLTGFFRKEEFEDLKGIRTEGISGTVPEIVAEQALTFLQKPHEKISFVESDSCRYKSKVNYDLGDKIIVRDEFGNYGKVRCTKITETFDNNGYRCIPTLDEWEQIPVILRTHNGARFITSDEKQVILKGGK